MSSQFPAIIIGGPPHRGKSVFSTILSDFLRNRQIMHYRYQATPDGDGKWFTDMHDRPAADAFRNKYPWDPYFEEVVETVLNGRPLPFLVDVGGKPTPVQQALFSLATHAIILGATAQELDEWRAIVERQGLIVIAEIHSLENGTDAILSAGDPLVVRLAGLHRGQRAADKSSAAWAAVVTATQAVFQDASDSAWDYYWPGVDSEYVPFHAEQWLRRHTGGRTTWHPEDLVALCSILDPATPLALFADYPTWVAPTVATRVHAPLLFFDARFGWLPLPGLIAADPSGEYPWIARVAHGQGFTALRLRLRGPHLLPALTLHGPLPTVPDGVALVIDGQLPRWLFAAFARFYAAQGHQVGIALPRDEQALIVNGQAMGSLIPWLPLTE